MMRSVLGILLPVLASQAAPVEDGFFSEKVYPVLEKAECRACHQDNGVSSATRLQFPAADAGPEAVRAFGLRLARLVDRGDASRSPLLLKPTMRVAHAGGPRIAKGSPEEQVLRTWVEHLASLPEARIDAAIEQLVAAGRPAKRGAALRRLTHSQYNNTVRDLLGDFTRPADQFPPEDFLHGFTNQAEGQSIPPLLAEAYTTAAEKLAANAFRFGDRNKLIPCKPTSGKDAACRDQFVRQFGLRAFRRPLTPPEMTAYAGLFAGKPDFLGGAQVVVEAMLQSPSFLFHLEDGPGAQGRPYGIASRLSYFLWDTMPDAELFRAAAAGEWKTEASVRQTARRMLDTPQARRSFDNFLAQWMRFDRVQAAIRNPRRYPDFSNSLLPVMTEETRHLFQHLAWSDRNFMEFFNADYTFLSARLASHYGWPAPEREFAVYRYPPDALRAGVLGHASLLTMTGTQTDTSPTARGLFVREHFLCQAVPPPPPGVDTNLPDVSLKPMTQKQRLEVHLRNPSCASCHALIDPIGFGFENYDNVGRYRKQLVLTVDRQRDAVTNARIPPKEFSLDLDTAANIQGIPNSQFSNLKELGNILANDPTCQRCVMKQVFRYATGRHEAESERAQLDTLFAAFQKSGYQFRELVLSLVTSPLFLGEPAKAVASR